MQTPEPMLPPRSASDPYEGRPVPRQPVPGYWGERLAWIAGLVLAISAFTEGVSNRNAWARVGASSRACSRGTSSPIIEPTFFTMAEWR